MESDDGTLDWDAAFEALVADLHTPRYRRIVRVAWQAAAAGVAMAAAAWMVVHMVADALGDFGRPWR